MKKASISLLLIAAAILSALPLVDHGAEQKYEGMFQRALVTFAIARTLNGVISAVQGTELALQPAGVGLTLTPGEILDPVNDLVERFSWVMLAATVSLGIQQVLLDISGSVWIRVLAAVCCFLMLLLVLFPKGMTRHSVPVLVRILAVILFIRLAVPLTFLANEFIYQIFLDARYQESTLAISDAGTKLEEASAQEEARLRETDNKSPGLFGSIERAVDGAAQALDLRSRLAQIQDHAGRIIQHLIQMSVIFIFQTALMPVFFLWILLQAARRLVAFQFSNPMKNL